MTRSGPGDESDERRANVSLRASDRALRAPAALVVSIAVGFGLLLAAVPGGAREGETPRVRGGRAEEPYRWRLPEGVAPPPVPADNPMSEAKVELGRRLFFERGLSFNGSTSCASCHDPARDFTDGLARSHAASGEPTARNAPSLWNVAYGVSFTWIDRGLSTLEAQLGIPLTGTTPVEMGFGPEQARALARDPALRRLQRAAFGDAPLGETTVIQALACYVRTLVRMDGGFDRYLLYDDRSGFSMRARDGMALFFSQRLGCGHCHAGPHLSGPTAEPGRTVAPVFHRTAVSDSTTAFRAPSLRFVRRTAPYMHDGSLATLEDVVAFYERGGGKGAERLKAFTLTRAEREALLAFLDAL